MIRWTRRNRSPRGGSAIPRRLPVYHRLDLSCSKRFTIDPVRVTIGVSVINVYDRKNIFYLDRNTGEHIYMLRFAPSVLVKSRTMRLLFGTCAVACAIVSASGCNEDFSPKVPGGNRYYLFCIVNATPRGGDVQFAVVDRMYDVEGLNPAQNTVDPFVAGTEIRLTVRGEQYVFRQDSMARLDTSRYTTRVRYYTATGITIVAFDVVSVQAILPDSTVLSGIDTHPGLPPGRVDSSICERCHHASESLYCR